MRYCPLWMANGDLVNGSLGYKKYFAPLARLIPELGRHKKLVVLVFSTLMIYRLVLAAISVCSAWAVAEALKAHQITEQVWWVLASLILMVLAVGVSWWLDMWFAHVYSYRIIANLRIRLYDALDRANPSGLGERTTGEVAGAAMADLETTEWFYAHTIIDFLSVALSSAVFCSVMVWLVGPVGFIILPLVVLILGIPLVTLRLQTVQGERIRTTLATQKGHCLETIQGSREIITLGLEDQQIQALELATDRVQRFKRDYLLRIGIEIAVTQLLVSVFTILTLGVLIKLNDQGSVELSHIPPAMVLLNSGCGAALGVANMMRKLGEVSAATQRYLEITDLPQAIPDTGTEEMPDVAAGVAIAIREVAFAYGAVDIFSDLNLEIPAGVTLALVGRTGAGKSTIASLIVRQREPYRGCVMLNGLDVRFLPLARLRQLVTLVPQHPYIFRGTVRDNLTMACPEASEDRIWQALAKAKLDHTVRELPHGLDSLIGERAATLSGGQRQRLSLAQAFLRDSPVLIMDESVSNLDPALEKQLGDITAELRRGRTTLVIAHRLSTIARAELVAVLDQGKIQAIGSHEELLSSSPVYRKLLAHQLESDNNTGKNGQRRKEVTT